MKHLVCYSGGHSSALVAIEVYRKYGNDDLILLNHDISSEVEHDDIKRFKKEVAEYIGVPITYANMNNWDKETPLDVCSRIGAFKVGNGTALCTNRLKTKPFMEYLGREFPLPYKNENVIIYYGFDKSETVRITRRSQIMGAYGYKTEFPLAFWDRTLEDIEDIGIKRPITYELFRHANCIGCLKAGKQQWYVVYCMYPEYYQKAMKVENEIGYSILKQGFLKEFICEFENMKQLGIVPSEKVSFQSFWAKVKRIFKETDILPCECSI